MSEDKRAYSWQQFKDSGFDGSDYAFSEAEGTFEGTIACKRWDKKNNLLVYLDMDDGDRIITSAWADSGYHGLADLPVGARVKVTFKQSAKGNIYLQSAEKAET